MQITFNAFAYKAQHHDMTRIEAGKEMPYVWTYEPGDTDEYAHIGNAVVTITLFPANERQARELSALKNKLQEVRAENQKRENAILDQISKLQALSYEAA